MICLACGAKLEADAVACTVCGAPTPKGASAGKASTRSLLRSGQRLADRYLIKRSLGVGRLGVTYHVTDLDTGRDVALKMMFRHLLFSKRDRLRFQDWMAATRSLSSPCLAAPQRSGRDEEVGSFVINELIDGPSLAQVQASRTARPGLDEVASLVAQLRRALQELPSDQPHGGLHPGNVLILPDRVVLTDIATYQGVLPQLWSEAHRQGLGGASWLAPEVMQGREDLDGRADVYSVAGLVMWILSGVEPGERALERVRAEFPGVAGVLKAAFTDLASERLFEVTPIEAALIEAARRQPVLSAESTGGSTGGYIQLDESDLLVEEDAYEEDAYEEATEITSSEELSIREEDVLGVESLVEEPTPIHTKPPAPTSSPPPDTKPAAAVVEAQVAAAEAPTQEPKAPEAVKPLRPEPVLTPQPQRKAKRRSRLTQPLVFPRWFVFAACALTAFAGTFVLSEMYLMPAIERSQRQRPRPASALSPTGLTLEDEEVAVDAGTPSAAPTAAAAAPRSIADDEALAARTLAALQRQDNSDQVQPAADAGTAQEPAAATAQPATSDAGSAAQGLAPAQDVPETQPAAPDDAQPVRVVRAPAAAVAPEEPVEPVAERVTEAPAPVAPKATPQPKLRKRPSGRATCKKGMGLVRTSQGAVCVDRYEYPNYLRSAPQGNFNAYKAQALCAKKGKRICSEREWVAACSGKGGSSFPYGSRFVAGRCNTLEDGRDEAVAPLEYKKCRSGARIYALAGNLAEWTKTSSGFALKGGSYAHGGSESRCRGRLTASPRVAQPEFGVRCCANPTYE